MTDLPPPPPAMVKVVSAAEDYWRSQGVNIPPYTVSAGSKYASVTHYPYRPAHMRLNPDLDQMPREEQARVALHELVHVAQGYNNVVAFPTAWTEGQADALALDNVCPFMARTWSPAIARIECRGAGPGYEKETAAVRTYSARITPTPWRSYTARLWRIDNLRAISWGRS